MNFSIDLTKYNVISYVLYNLSANPYRVYRPSALRHAHTDSERFIYFRDVWNNKRAAFSWMSRKIFPTTISCHVGVKIQLDKITKQAFYKSWLSITY